MAQLQVRVQELLRKLNNTDVLSSEYLEVLHEIQEVHQGACRKYRIKGEFVHALTQAELWIKRLEQEQTLYDTNKRRHSSYDKEFKFQEKLAGAYYTAGNIIRLTLDQMQFGANPGSMFVDADTYFQKSLTIRRRLLEHEMKLSNDAESKYSGSETIHELHLQLGQCLSSIAILQHTRNHKQGQKYEKEALNTMALIPLENADEQWAFSPESGSWHVTKKLHINEEKHSEKSEGNKTGWRARIGLKFSRTQKPVDKPVEKPVDKPVEKSLSRTKSKDRVVEPMTSTSRDSQSSSTRNRTSSSLSDNQLQLEPSTNNLWILTAQVNPGEKCAENLPSHIDLDGNLELTYVFGKRLAKETKGRQLCHIQLKPSGLIAKRHAELSYSTKYQSWVIRDVSDYGLLVNRLRVKTCTIKEGDEVVFGGCTHVKPGETNFDGNLLDSSPYVYKLERVYEINPDELIPRGVFMEGGSSDFAFRHFYAMVMSEHIRKKSNGHSRTCRIALSHDDVQRLFSNIRDEMIPIHLWHSWIQSRT